MTFKHKETKGKHKLPPKKILMVMRSESHPNFYKIAYEEGGTLPSELRSQFTSKKKASESIQAYLTKKEINKPYLEHVRDKEYGKAESEERK